MGYYLISSHHQCRVTNRRPDQTERARLGIICMRHTIASRCSKLCFCAIPSDKNHLCNGSLQQSKDVILRANQNSEYLERMHFVFIIRIISTKFIVENIYLQMIWIIRRAGQPFLLQLRQVFFQVIWVFQQGRYLAAWTTVRDNIFL